MNREDFGRLIAALRKEHGDEALKPWTQTMLAEEANLAADVDLFTKDMISKVCITLATTLKLTSGERKEFFLVASGVDSQDIPRWPFGNRTVHTRADLKSIEHQQLIPSNKSLVTFSAASLGSRGSCLSVAVLWISKAIAITNWVTN